MKYMWVCRWEIAGGDGEHEERFDSFSEAVRAMRKKIAECIDLEEYIGDLEPVAATYLRNYLTDPEFPRSEADVPGDDDWELPDEGDLALYANWIRWQYPFDAYPVLNTNLVMNPSADETCFFDFHYEYPEEATGHGVAGLNIRIIPAAYLGTGAYPLLVCAVLGEEPQTQDKIAQMIRRQFRCGIERKAVGRHLQLLQDLGYPVQKCEEGYYLKGESRPPRTDVKYTAGAYPLLILEVLSDVPKTKTELRNAVQEKFGVKMDRKAVDRNLELLTVLGYHVEKNNNGYYRKERRVDLYAF